MPLRQATGGRRSREIALKAATPSSEPTRSSRYASSGRKRPNVRATPSPMKVIVAATAMKITVSVSARGGPLLSRAP